MRTRLVSAAFLLLVALSASVLAHTSQVILDARKVQGTVRSASAVVPAGAVSVRVVVDAKPKKAGDLVWRLWLSTNDGQTWTVIHTETESLARTFALLPSHEGNRLLVELDSLDELKAAVELRWGL